MKKKLLLDDKHISLLIVVYVIITINVIFQCIYVHDFYTLILASEYFPAFTLVYIRQQLSSHKVWQSVYSIFMTIWIGFIFLIDFYCIHILHTPFDYDIVQLIVGSNPNESTEFLKLYASQVATLHGLSVFGSVILILLAYKFFLRKIHYPKFFHKVASIAVIVSIGACFYKCYLPDIEKREFQLAPTAKYFFQKTSIFFKIKEEPDLDNYYSHPSIDFDENKLPQNIVMIIGESLSKDHCSLYGYEKPTNVLLQHLAESGYLLVADSVDAPAIQTVPAFKYFMSTYSHKNQEQMQWYEGLTLIEVFDIMGYKTQWLSNQQKTGFYDNVVTKYANLCDTTYFVSEVQNPLIKKRDQYYDEALLPILHTAMNDTIEKNLYFIHLMGSHNLYKERYPATFKRFQPDEYVDKPLHQQTTWAEYDTSVAYNDSVVSEMIQAFADKEALVIYFSDHGQDFYQSKADYAGHASNNIVSYNFGIRIPFMIYLSPAYQEHFPDKASQLKRMLQEFHSTEDLIYLLMDVVDAKLLTN